MQTCALLVSPLLFPRLPPMTLYRRQNVHHTEHSCGTTTNRVFVYSAHICLTLSSSLFCRCIRYEYNDIFMMILLRSYICQCVVVATMALLEAGGVHDTLTDERNSQGKGV